MHTRNAYMYFFFFSLFFQPLLTFISYFYINTTTRTKDTIDPRIPLATFRLFTKPCSRVYNYSIRYTCQRAPIVSVEVHPDTVNVLSVFCCFFFMCIYIYFFTLPFSPSLILFQSFTFFPFQFSFNLAHYHRYK